MGDDKICKKIKFLIRSPPRASGDDTVIIEDDKSVTDDSIMFIGVYRRGGI